MTTLEKRWLRFNTGSISVPLKHVYIYMMHVVSGGVAVFYVCVCHYDVM
jgi:hypothetical protein